MPAPPDRPASAPSPPAPSTPRSDAPVDASVEDNTLLAVSKALRNARLLNRPDACYAYRFDSAPGRGAYVVDVMENHRHAECGGDPGTQPHLFTVHVDKTTRVISQDVHTPGDFQPLTP